MARFDVYRDPDGPGYVLDCQADLLNDLPTRVMVPLLPADIAPKAIPRMNPEFEIEGITVRLSPQFIASIPVAALDIPLTSLAHHDYAICNAIDVILSGI